MPNKHFCQGPHCHTYTTTDRFLKSKGIIRGRYAYSTMDRTPNQLFTLLSGFVLLMLGVILAIHYDFTIGLLITASGFFMFWAMLPQHKERL